MANFPTMMTITNAQMQLLTKLHYNINAKPPGILICYIT